MCLAVVALVGCTSSIANPTPSSAPSAPVAPLLLAPAGGCADAYFFAIDSTATSLLQIAVDVGDRSTTAPTEYDFTLPDPKISVALSRGVELQEGMCNDFITKMRIDSTTKAATGSVHLTVDPSTGTGPFGACGGISGTATTKGLTMTDGTVIADLAITTKDLGCYAG